MHLLLNNLTGLHSHMSRHLILVIFFAILYWICGKIESHYKMNVLDKSGIHTREKVIPLTLFRSFYFSLITQTTVGYGHHPSPTLLSQFINMLQLLSIIGVYVF